MATPGSIEKVYVDHDTFKVTSARFIVPAQTYAMAGITSVRGSVYRPPVVGNYICTALGVAILIYGLGVATWAVILGAILAGIGYLNIRAAKPVYSIIVMTAGGESEAVRSENSALISELIEGINQAIVERV